MPYSTVRSLSPEADIAQLGRKFLFFYENQIFVEFIKSRQCAYSVPVEYTHIKVL
jgi:hypothetical protein